MTNLNKWKYFVGASILVGGLLLRLGAPLLTVILGVAAAALLTRWRERSA